jgi:hypothetical protein
MGNTEQQQPGLRLISAGQHEIEDRDAMSDACRILVEAHDRAIATPGLAVDHRDWLVRQRRRLVTIGGLEPLFAMGGIA